MKQKIPAGVLTVCMALSLLSGTAAAAVIPAPSGGGDTLYDILINDGCFSFSGSAVTNSGEEADVESVLELTGRLDTPIPPETAFS